jgi:serine/threonine protein kinase
MILWIHKIVKHETNQNRAVKKKAMKIMDQLNSATMNELEILSTINHENIVRYFDHFHKKIGGEDKTFLIMEYCEVSR